MECVHVSEEVCFIGTRGTLIHRLKYRLYAHEKYRKRFGKPPLCRKCEGSILHPEKAVLKGESTWWHDNCRASLVVIKTTNDLLKEKAEQLMKFGGPIMR